MNQPSLLFTNEVDVTLLLTVDSLSYNKGFLQHEGLKDGGRSPPW